ncbi:uncharacterized protein N7482_007161 [Penicillium canariense]|uniref:Uncharacterized protein n=1 Tax=Penicillium canariense TaxID=189055 RepID=A0A9W9LIU8_9EURO|nr:uncharacterized protein N7482_007161 [Penicillium canariense]KAJ5160157.1 hypothetical protein N7482_007161 [Penicillium canariense]
MPPLGLENGNHTSLAQPINANEWSPPGAGLVRGKVAAGSWDMKDLSSIDRNIRLGSTLELADRSSAEPC